MAAVPAQRASRLNLSDVPELMPGAQAKSTPAQREDFEKRSRQLHYEEAEERSNNVAFSNAAAGVGVTTTELEEMFPALDKALIRTLRSEARSAQEAIETLLALSAATAEPVAGTTASNEGETNPVSPSKPLRLGVEDHNKFPSLIDADGWQVPCKRLQAHNEEELGNAWRDCAKAAVEKPPPKPAARPLQGAWGRKQQDRQKTEGEEAAEEKHLFTDYEYRHQMGERRARHRVQYGRGGGGRGIGVGRGCGTWGAGGGQESESEADEEWDAET